MDKILVYSSIFDRFDKVVRSVGFSSLFLVGECIIGFAIFCHWVLY